MLLPLGLIAWCNACKLFFCGLRLLWNSIACRGFVWLESQNKSEFISNLIMLFYFVRCLKGDGESVFVTFQGKQLVGTAKKGSKRSPSCILCSAGGRVGAESFPPEHLLFWAPAGCAGQDDPIKALVLHEPSPLLLQQACSALPSRSFGL